MNICPYCNYWNKPALSGEASSACSNCGHAMGGAGNLFRRKDLLHWLEYAAFLLLAILLLLPAAVFIAKSNRLGLIIAPLSFVGSMLAFRKAERTWARLENQPEATLQGELGQLKSSFQTRLLELSKLRDEEQEADGQDTNRTATRLSLVSRAIDSVQLKLLEIETQEKSRDIALWLNRLDWLVWDFRQLKNLSPRGFKSLLERLQKLRAEGQNQASLPAGIQLTGAPEAIAAGLSKLDHLEQYLRDRRVLEAVGGDAMPEPEFLRAEPEPAWPLPLLPSLHFDDLEGVNQEALHEIKGLLRVSER